MLKDYFAKLTTDQERRVMAVEAALEIAKASVSAPSSYTGIKTEFDLKKSHQRSMLWLMQSRTLWKPIKRNNDFSI